MVTPKKEENQIHMVSRFINTEKVTEKKSDKLNLSAEMKNKKDEKVDDFD